MQKFRVINNSTGREYTVTDFGERSMDTIWLSEKAWFTSGSSVTIIAEDGTSKTYIKE